MVFHGLKTILAGRLFLLLFLHVLLLPIRCIYGLLLLIAHIILVQKWLKPIHYIFEHLIEGKPKFSTLDEDTVLPGWSRFGPQRWRGPNHLFFYNVSSKTRRRFFFPPVPRWILWVKDTMPHDFRDKGPIMKIIYEYYANVYQADPTFDLWMVLSAYRIDQWFWRYAESFAWLFGFYYFVIRCIVLPIVDLCIYILIIVVSIDYLHIPLIPFKWLLKALRRYYFTFLWYSLVLSAYICAFFYKKIFGIFGATGHINNPLTYKETNSISLEKPYNSWRIFFISILGILICKATFVIEKILPNIWSKERRSARDKIILKIILTCYFISSKCLLEIFNIFIFLTTGLISFFKKIIKHNITRLWKFVTIQMLIFYIKTFIKVIRLFKFLFEKMRSIYKQIETFDFNKNKLQAYKKGVRIYLLCLFLRLCLEQLYVAVYSYYFYWYFFKNIQLNRAATLWKTLKTTMHKIFMFVELFFKSIQTAPKKSFILQKIETIFQVNLVFIAQNAWMHLSKLLQTIIIILREYSLNIQGLLKLKIMKPQKFYTKTSKMLMTLYSRWSYVQMSLMITVQKILINITIILLKISVIIYKLITELWDCLLLPIFYSFFILYYITLLLLVKVPYLILKWFCFIIYYLSIIFPLKIFLLTIQLLLLFFIYLSKLTLFLCDGFFYIMTYPNRYKNMIIKKFKFLAKKKFKLPTFSTENTQIIVNFLKLKTAFKGYNCEEFLLTQFLGKVGSFYSESTLLQSIRTFRALSIAQFVPIKRTIKSVEFALYVLFYTIIFTFFYLFLLSNFFKTIFIFAFSSFYLIVKILISLNKRYLLPLFFKLFLLFLYITYDVAMQMLVLTTWSINNIKHAVLIALKLPRSFFQTVSIFLRKQKDKLALKIILIFKEEQPNIIKILNNKIIKLKLKSFITKTFCYYQLLYKLVWSNEHSVKVICIRILNIVGCFLKHVIGEMLTIVFLPFWLPKAILHLIRLVFVFFEFFFFAVFSFTCLLHSFFYHVIFKFCFNFIKLPENVDLRHSSLNEKPYKLKNDSKYTLLVLKTSAFFYNLVIHFILNLMFIFMLDFLLRYLCYLFANNFVMKKCWCVLNSLISKSSNIISYILKTAENILHLLVYTFNAKRWLCLSHSVLKIIVFAWKLSFSLLTLVILIKNTIFLKLSITYILTLTFSLYLLKVFLYGLFLLAYFINKLLIKLIDVYSYIIWNTINKILIPFILYAFTFLYRNYCKLLLAGYLLLCMVLVCILFFIHVLINFLDMLVTAIYLTMFFWVNFKIFKTLRILLFATFWSVITIFFVITLFLWKFSKTLQRGIIYFFIALYALKKITVIAILNFYKVLVIIWFFFINKYKITVIKMVDMLLYAILFFKTNTAKMGENIAIFLQRPMFFSIDFFRKLKANIPELKNIFMFTVLTKGITIFNFFKNKTNFLITLSKDQLKQVKSEIALNWAVYKSKPTVIEALNAINSQNSFFYWIKTILTKTLRTSIYILRNFSECVLIIIDFVWVLFKKTLAIYWQILGLFIDPMLYIIYKVLKTLAHSIYFFFVVLETLIKNTLGFAQVFLNFLIKLEDLTYSTILRIATLCWSIFSVIFKLINIFFFTISIFIPYSIVILFVFISNFVLNKAPNFYYNKVKRFFLKAYTIFNVFYFKLVVNNYFINQKTFKIDYCRNWYNNCMLHRQFIIDKIVNSMRNGTNKIITYKRMLVTNIYNHKQVFIFNLGMYKQTLNHYFETSYFFFISKVKAYQIFFLNSYRKQEQKIVTYYTKYEQAIILLFKKCNRFFFDKYDLYKPSIISKYRIRKQELRSLVISFFSKSSSMKTVLERFMFWLLFKDGTSLRNPIAILFYLHFVIHIMIMTALGYLLVQIFLLTKLNWRLYSINIIKFFIKLTQFFFIRLINYFIISIKGFILAILISFLTLKFLIKITTKLLSTLYKLTTGLLKKSVVSTLTLFVTIIVKCLNLIAEQLLKWLILLMRRTLSSVSFIFKHIKNSIITAIKQLRTSTVKNVFDLFTHFYIAIKCYLDIHWTLFMTCTTFFVILIGQGFNLFKKLIQSISSFLDKYKLTIKNINKKRSKTKGSCNNGFISPLHYMNVFFNLSVLSKIISRSYQFWTRWAFAQAIFIKKTNNYLYVKAENLQISATALFKNTQNVSSLFCLQVAFCYNTALIYSRTRVSEPKILVNIKFVDKFILLFEKASLLKIRPFNFIYLKCLKEFLIFSISVVIVIMSQPFKLLYKFFTFCWASCTKTITTSYETNNKKYIFLRKLSVLYKLCLLFLHYRRELFKTFDIVKNYLWFQWLKYRIIKHEKPKIPFYGSCRIKNSFNVFRHKLLSKKSDISILRILYFLFNVLKGRPFLHFIKTLNVKKYITNTYNKGLESLYMKVISLLKEFYITAISQKLLQQSTFFINKWLIKQLKRYRNHCIYCLWTNFLFIVRTSYDAYILTKLGLVKLSEKIKSKILAILHITNIIERLANKTYNRFMLIFYLPEVVEYNIATRLLAIIKNKKKSNNYIASVILFFKKMGLHLKDGKTLKVLDNNIKRNILGRWLFLTDNMIKRISDQIFKKTKSVRNFLFLFTKNNKAIKDSLKHILIKITVNMTNIFQLFSPNNNIKGLVLRILLLIKNEKIYEKEEINKRLSEILLKNTVTEYSLKVFLIKLYNHLIFLTLKFFKRLILINKSLNTAIFNRVWNSKWYKHISCYKNIWYSFLYKPKQPASPLMFILNSIDRAKKLDTHLVLKLKQIASSAIYAANITDELKKIVIYIILKLKTLQNKNFKDKVVSTLELLQRSFLKKKTQTSFLYNKAKTAICRHIVNLYEALYLHHTYKHLKGPTISLFTKGINKFRTIKHFFIRLRTKYIEHKNMKYKTKWLTYDHEEHWRIETIYQDWKLDMLADIFFYLYAGVKSIFVLPFLHIYTYAYMRLNVKLWALRKSIHSVEYYIGDFHSIWITIETLLENFGKKFYKDFTFPETEGWKKLNLSAHSKTFLLLRILEHGQNLYVLLEKLFFIIMVKIASSVVLFIRVFCIYSTNLYIWNLYGLKRLKVLTFNKCRYFKCYTDHYAIRNINKSSFFNFQSLLLYTYLLITQKTFFIENVVGVFLYVYLHIGKLGLIGTYFNVYFSMVKKYAIRFKLLYFKIYSNSAILYNGIQNQIKIYIKQLVYEMNNTFYVFIFQNNSKYIIFWMIRTTAKVFSAMSTIIQLYVGLSLEAINMAVKIVMLSILIIQLIINLVIEIKKVIVKLITSMFESFLSCINSGKKDVKNTILTFYDDVKKYCRYFINRAYFLSRRIILVLCEIFWSQITSTFYQKMFLIHNAIIVKHQDFIGYIGKIRHLMFHDLYFFNVDKCLNIFELYFDIKIKYDKWRDQYIRTKALTSISFLKENVFIYQVRFFLNNLFKSIEPLIDQKLLGLIRRLTWCMQCLIFPMLKENIFQLEKKISYYEYLLLSKNIRNIFFILIFKNNFFLVQFVPENELKILWFKTIMFWNKVNVNATNALKTALKWFCNTTQNTSIKCWENIKISIKGLKPKPFLTIVFQGVKTYTNILNVNLIKSINNVAYLIKFETESVKKRGFLLLRYYNYIIILSKFIKIRNNYKFICLVERLHKKVVKFLVTCGFVLKYERLYLINILNCRKIFLRFFKNTFVKILNIYVNGLKHLLIDFIQKKRNLFWGKFKTKASITYEHLKHINLNDKRLNFYRILTQKIHFYVNVTKDKAMGLLNDIICFSNKYRVYLERISSILVKYIYTSSYEKTLTFLIYTIKLRTYIFCFMENLGLTIIGEIRDIIFTPLFEKTSSKISTVVILYLIFRAKTLHIAVKMNKVFVSKAKINTIDEFLSFVNKNLNDVAKTSSSLLNRFYEKIFTNLEWFLDSYVFFTIKELRYFILRILLPLHLKFFNIYCNRIPRLIAETLIPLYYGTIAFLQEYYGYCKIKIDYSQDYKGVHWVIILYYFFSWLLNTLPATTIFFINDLLHNVFKERYVFFKLLMCDLLQILPVFSSYTDIWRKLALQEFPELNQKRLDFKLDLSSIATTLIGVSQILFKYMFKWNWGTLKDSVDILMRAYCRWDNLYSPIRTIWPRLRHISTLPPRVVTATLRPIKQYLMQLIVLPIYKARTLNNFTFLLWLTTCAPLYVYIYLPIRYLFMKYILKDTSGNTSIDDVVVYRLIGRIFQCILFSVVMYITVILLWYFHIYVWAKLDIAHIHLHVDLPGLQKTRLFFLIIVGITGTVRFYDTLILHWLTIIQKIFLYGIIVWVVYEHHHTLMELFLHTSKPAAPGELHNYSEGRLEYFLAWCGNETYLWLVGIGRWEWLYYLWFLHLIHSIYWVYFFWASCAFPRMFLRQEVDLYVIYRKFSAKMELLPRTFFVMIICFYAMYYIYYFWEAYPEEFPFVTIDLDIDADDHFFKPILDKPVEYFFDSIYATSASGGSQQFRHAEEVWLQNFWQDVDTLLNRSMLCKDSIENYYWFFREAFDDDVFFTDKKALELKATYEKNPVFPSMWTFPELSSVDYTIEGKYDLVSSVYHKMPPADHYWFVEGKNKLFRIHPAPYWEGWTWYDWCCEWWDDLEYWWEGWEWDWGPEFYDVSADIPNYTPNIDGNIRSREDKTSPGVFHTKLYFTYWEHRFAKGTKFFENSPHFSDKRPDLKWRPSNAKWGGIHRMIVMPEEATYSTGWQWFKDSVHEYLLWIWNWDNVWWETIPIEVGWDGLLAHEKTTQLYTLGNLDDTFFGDLMEPNPPIDLPFDVHTSWPRTVLEKSWDDRANTSVATIRKGFPPFYVGSLINYINTNYFDIEVGINSYLDAEIKALAYGGLDLWDDVFDYYILAGSLDLEPTEIVSEKEFLSLIENNRLERFYDHFFIDKDYYQFLFWLVGLISQYIYKGFVIISPYVDFLITVISALTIGSVFDMLFFLIIYCFIMLCTLIKTVGSLPTIIIFICGSLFVIVWFVTYLYWSIFSISYGVIVKMWAQTDTIIVFWFCLFKKSEPIYLFHAWLKTLASILIYNVTSYTGVDFEVLTLFVDILTLFWEDNLAHNYQYFPWKYDNIIIKAIMRFIKTLLSSTINTHKLQSLIEHIDGSNSITVTIFKEIWTIVRLCRIYLKAIL